MSAYADGRRFEHKTRTHLRANGYEVLRAAGSKGTSKIDLVAFKPGQLLLVQCKRSGTLPAAEWDRLVQVASWVGATAVLAANGPNGRGVTYTHLLGPKVPHKRSQSVAPLILDELEQPSVMPAGNACSAGTALACPCRRAGVEATR